MPEVAEVRLIADNLETFLKGKIISSLNLRNPEKTTNWAKRSAKGLSNFQVCLPLKVYDVHTKGKFCWLELEKGWKIGIQFGMSGNIRKDPTSEYLQVFNQNKSKKVTKDEYLKHCHLEIIYHIIGDANDMETLYYHDIRRFGSWTFYAENELDKFQSKLDKLGYDPLSVVNLNQNVIVNQFRKYNHKNICKVLMDQNAIFAGVGNYMKSESLYKAKIYPFANICHITDIALYNLYLAIVEIAQNAYKSGGATLYTFTGMNGDQTKFKETLQVYKKDMDPLGNKVNTIQDKKSPDKRSTFWVPEIQNIGIQSNSINITNTNTTNTTNTKNTTLIKIQKIKKIIT